MTTATRRMTTVTGPMWRGSLGALNEQRRRRRRCSLAEPDHAVKGLGSDGSGSYEDVASAIIYAADNGADVINMSLGGATPSDTLLDAMEYAYNAGVVLVAASGQ